MLYLRSPYAPRSVLPAHEALTPSDRRPHPPSARFLPYLNQIMGSVQPAGKVAFITGGNGITGSAILEHLAKHTSSQEWARIVVTSRSPFVQLVHDPRIQFVALDFTKKPAVLAAEMRAAGCDDVTHAYFSSYIHKVPRTGNPCPHPPSARTSLSSYCITGLVACCCRQGTESGWPLCTSATQQDATLLGILALRDTSFTTHLRLVSTRSLIQNFVTISCRHPTRPKSPPTPHPPFFLSSPHKKWPALADRALPLAPSRMTSPSCRPPTRPCSRTSSSRCRRSPGRTCRA